MVGAGQALKHVGARLGLNCQHMPGWEALLSDGLHVTEAGQLSGAPG